MPTSPIRKGGASTMMSIERIFPEGGATPRGHYTPGIRAGDFIYVSGQGPIDPIPA